MRMFGEHDLNYFIIEGVTQGPMTDFELEVNGTKISIKRKSTGLYDLSNIAYTSIQDFDGDGFASVAALQAYFIQETTPSLKSETLIKSFTAGEAISAMKAVYLSSGSQVRLAKHNGTSAESKAIGISLQGVSNGDPVDVHLFGALDDGSFSFAANAAIFLGASGALTTTPPTSGYLTALGLGLGTGSVFIKTEKPIAL